MLGVLHCDKSQFWQLWYVELDDYQRQAQLLCSPVLVNAVNAKSLKSLATLL